MRLIGFLIIAAVHARPASCATTYDFVATESQIEFGEVLIMETNELTGGSRAQG
jgi:hypothetical protein